MTADQSVSKMDAKWLIMVTWSPLTQAKMNVTNSSKRDTMDKQIQTQSNDCLRLTDPIIRQMLASKDTQLMIKGKKNTGWKLCTASISKIHKAKLMNTATIPMNPRILAQYKFVVQKQYFLAMLLVWKLYTKV